MSSSHNTGDHFHLILSQPQFFFRKVEPSQTLTVTTRIGTGYDVFQTLTK